MKSDKEKEQKPSSSQTQSSIRTRKIGQDQVIELRAASLKDSISFLKRLGKLGPGATFKVILLSDINKN